MNAMGIMRAALIAALLVQGGCGGGSNDTQMGGIEGTGFARGTITGFGSVFVNGVEYSTNGAVITIDDNPGTESDLRVGQVVTIEGPVSADGRTGTAHSVSFDAEVEGPISSIDVSGNSLVVLGQVVRVDGDTSFDSSIGGLADLAVNDMVEVSGFRNSVGEILATRVESKAAGGTSEVHGTVTAVDTTAMHLSIGALDVDYSFATLQDFPNGRQPAVADVVEVKGNPNAGGVFVAQTVELKNDELPAANDDDGEIEGLITRFVSNTDFDVNGQPVSTVIGTAFENGTSADLALNVKVEVEGTFNSGVLNATKISFRTSTGLRLTATVDALDAANQSFTALGVTVGTNSLTRFEDKLSQPVSPFGFGQLRVGDYVEARGSAGSTASSIVAAIVERDEPRTDVEVRGLASNVAAPQLTILGVTVMTNSSTQFRDASDNSITSAQFFLLAPAKQVNAKGTFAANILTADEIELEN